MSDVIGKGPEAAEALMLEVEAMFDMTVLDREYVDAAVSVVTRDDEPDWTYGRFYEEVLKGRCRISGQPLESEDDTDGDGCPDGGWVEGCGIQIRWQRGTLDRDAEGAPWNGAFPVTVLEAVQRRLRYYQSGKFACADNDDAIACIQAAIDALNKRQLERFTRGVRDSHAG